MANMTRKIEEYPNGIIMVESTWYQVGAETYATWDDIPEEVIVAAALGEVHIGRGSSRSRLPNPNPTPPPESDPQEAARIVNEIYGGKPISGNDASTMTPNEIITEIYGN